MLLDRFRVQPNDKRKFTIDYTQRLQDSNLLTVVNSIGIEPVTSPPFAVTAGVDPARQKVILYSSGGVDSTEYKMTILVATDDVGQCWEDELIFSCDDT